MIRYYSNKDQYIVDLSISIFELLTDPISSPSSLLRPSTPT